MQPWLEKTLQDHPHSISLVHRYDSIPAVNAVVQELYGTDFGRCYLGSKTLIDHYADDAPDALLKSYKEEGYNDYGAHYHIMRLFGWLQVHEAYDLLVDALHNKQPQFQKSRIAAAFSLAELGEAKAIPKIKKALAVPIWDLQYSAILALEKLGEPIEFPSSDSTDWLVQEKLASL